VAPATTSAAGPSSATEHYQLQPTAHGVQTYSAASAIGTDPSLNDAVNAEVVSELHEGIINCHIVVFGSNLLASSCT
jgi:hypothetical protein